MQENLDLLKSEGFFNGKPSQLVQMEKLDGIDLKKVFEAYQNTTDMSDYTPLFGSK